LDCKAFIFKRLGQILGWLFLQGVLVAKEPLAVYLTWVDDPATTMVVQWIESDKTATPRNTLYLQAKKGVWLSSLSQKVPIPQSEMVLNRVFLKELDPDTDYVFCLNSDIDQAKKYRFKTMSNQLFQPVRFVVGGDAYYHYDLFCKMNAMVARLSPDFVVLGGDIAYAANHGGSFKQSDWEWRRWKTFFKRWSEQMIDENGRLIPLLVAVGNHDTKGSYQTMKSKKREPGLFFSFFPFKESFGTYRNLLFGNYLALFLLDTGHVHPIDREQTAWLADALKESSQVSYKMAVYHQPAYGAYGNTNNRKAMLIRKNWSPLFEQYDLQLAFEHHNHVYARSKPIKEEKIASDGVVYLGEGTWGVEPRKALSPSELFYLEKSGQPNAVYLVTLGQKDCHLFAIDIDGKIFDEFTVQPLESSSKTRALRSAKAASADESSSFCVSSESSYK
jgi:acid phosphatase type 7